MILELGYVNVMTFVSIIPISQLCPVSANICNNKSVIRVGVHTIVRSGIWHKYAMFRFHKDVIYLVTVWISPDVAVFVSMFSFSLWALILDPLIGFQQMENFRLTQLI